MDPIGYPFLVVRQVVASEFPELEETSWRFCSQADQEHAESLRQYMHVFHKPGVICVAHDTDRLPPENIYGLFLHEFGHLIASLQDLPNHREGADYWEGEVEADRVVLDEIGIEMDYDDDEVQVVDPEDVREALAIKVGI